MDLHPFPTGHVHCQSRKSGLLSLMVAGNALANAWGSALVDCAYIDLHWPTHGHQDHVVTMTTVRSGLPPVFDKNASFKDRFKQFSELWLALKLKSLKTMFKLGELSLKTMFKILKTSVHNVVGPLTARGRCDVTISSFLRKLLTTESTHVDLLGNTALAKLPSKLQVGFSSDMYMVTMLQWTQKLIEDKGKTWTGEVKVLRLGQQTKS